MCRTTTVIGLVVLGWLVSISSSAAGRVVSPPPELDRVHILLVFDTDDPQLRESLALDKERMLHLWQTTISRDRYTLAILEGKDVRPERILAHYRKLRTGPKEGLVFFYGGHGATDPKRGHHFTLSCGRPLLRSALRKAMEAKKAGLVVILTDCCATPIALKPGYPKEAALRRRAVRESIFPTVRCLFFQARGTVDITAARDNASWSDKVRGGLFTRSLWLMMKTELRSLDHERAGHVSWAVFFPQLQKETMSLFGSWKKEWTARGEKIDSRIQQPHAFALGDSLETTSRACAVLSIHNASTDIVTYRFRWRGETTWTEATLKPGETRTHAHPLASASSPLPALEAQFEGVSRLCVLKPKLWQGQNAPPEGAGRAYRIRPR
jgi:hypothetical protein